MNVCINELRVHNSQSQNTNYIPEKEIKKKILLHKSCGVTQILQGIHSARNILNCAYKNTKTNY